MSNLSKVTLSRRWTPLSKKPKIGFVSTGPSVYSQSAPTGDPFDAFHDQYAKTLFTQTINGSNLPVLQFTNFVWSGVQGSMSAGPTWTWKSLGGVPTSLTYSVISNTGITSPISIAASLLTLNIVGSTPGYQYQLKLVASNADGSSTFISSPAQYNSDSVATFSSFAWAGGIGTTLAQPTWTWTFSSASSSPAPDTLRYELYADTSATPTTLIAAGSLPAGLYLYPYTTTFVYSAATLLNRYYKFILYTNNVASFSDTEQNLSSLTVPRFTLSSFNWNGTQGSTSSTPTWRWASAGGLPDTITATIYGDASSTPTTQLATQTGDSTFLTLGYLGSTVANYYYQLVVTGTNGIGTSSPPLTDTEQNILAAPTATITGFSWGGVIGSTSAAPSWTWSYGGGASTGVTWTLYGDSSATPTTVLDSGTSAITSYSYSGATVNTYYYKFSVTVTNGVSTGGFSDTQRSVGIVSVSIAAQSIGTGTLAAIAVTAASAYAATETIRLYQSKSTTDPGSTLSGYTIIATYPVPTVTGYDSYTYSGATIVGRYYRYNCVVASVSGTGFNSSNAQTTSMLCSAS